MLAIFWIQRSKFFGVKAPSKSIVCKTGRKSTQSGACRGVHPQLAENKFYGQTVKTHHAAGFSLSETRYTQGMKLSRHSHEAPYFCFILCGAYTESYGDRLRNCQPSMLIYHPAGELHAQRFDTAVQLFRIEVDPAELEDRGQAA